MSSQLFPYAKVAMSSADFSRSLKRFGILAALCATLLSLGTFCSPVSAADGPAAETLPEGLQVISLEVKPAAIELKPMAVGWVWWHSGETAPSCAVADCNDNSRLRRDVIDPIFHWATGEHVEPSGAVGGVNH